MPMRLKKYSLLLFVFIFQKLSFSQAWTQITDFPSAERDDGCTFVIGTTAFCGTGLKTGYILANDMYAFDMNTETWTSIASLPAGMERQYAAAFSYNNTGFIFGGAGSVYYNDLWMYDKINDKWQMKTPLPGVGRMGTSFFVIKDTAYIIGGKTATANSIDEMWAYNMLTDTWTQKTNLPFGSRWRAAATATTTKGYLVFGKDEVAAYKNELFEFNPATNTWTQTGTFPGKGRTYAAMKALDDDLFVIAGIDSLNNSHKEMWRYDLSASNWQQLAFIPSDGRRGGMCFNSATTIYYTTGINQSNSRLKETWKVFNPTMVDENEWNKQLDIYPNPATTTFTVEWKKEDLKPDVIEIRNCMGQLLNTIDTKNATEKTAVDLTLFPKGLYFLRLQNKHGSSTKKLIKE
jgi:N-acetylneuraminic acid mutarotase